MYLNGLRACKAAVEHKTSESGQEEGHVIEADDKTALQQNDLYKTSDTHNKFQFICLVGLTVTYPVLLNGLFVAFETDERV